MMDPLSFFLQLLGALLHWIVDIGEKLFVNWWLHWIQKQIANAITISDFEVRFVSGRQPLTIQLVFTVHNGSASTIELTKIALNLYESGVHLISVIGLISDNSLVDIQSTKINKDGSVNVMIEVVPFFQFWLSSNSYSFSLRKSSLDISTAYGNVTKLLEPAHNKIHNEIEKFEKAINEYVKTQKVLLSKEGRQ